MRIRELLEASNQQQLTAQILGVVDFLRNRAHDKQVLPNNSTQGFLTMVNNTAGMPGTLDFDSLEAMVNSNDKLKELITKLDRNTVEFKPFGDEPGAPQDMPADDQGASKAKDPTAVVDKMAKRAASKRD